MASRKDYYDILGIRRGATAAEIEKAYQKLIRTYYPPPGGNTAAEARFREISEAYEILSDKDKRERYDRSEPLETYSDFLGYMPEENDEEGPEEFSLDGFEDVFKQYFDPADGAISRHPQPGGDLYSTVLLDLEDVVQGTIKILHILQDIPCTPCRGTGMDSQSAKRVCSHCGGAGQIQIGLPPATFCQTCFRCQGTGRIPQDPCPVCSGKGRLKRKKTLTLRIPPGVANGCRIFFRGLGKMGQNRGPRGDLIVQLEVRDHPYFRRQGDDLFLCEVPLTIWEAALGVEIEVPSLKGMEKIKVPPAMQTGGEIRLPQAGIPHFHSEGRGDLVITFRVITPQDLPRRSQKIMEELKKLHPQDVRGNCIWRRKHR
jgi:molecular chaperone DnaJ